jgi:hypothetical protein
MWNGSKMRTKIDQVKLHHFPLGNPHKLEINPARTARLIAILGLLIGLVTLFVLTARDLVNLVNLESSANSLNIPISYNPSPLHPISATGPLRVNPANPRYFTDASGKAILLVGSDYWNLWQDGGRTNPPPAFDYDAFVQFAVSHGYDYLKSQTWEQARHITSNKYWYTQPTIWTRTGPGNALDGGPKFNLDVLNDEYFNRVRSRVMQAGQNGLYVVVDFFHGFSVIDKGNITDAWTAHPMNSANNINNIDGDPTDQGNGRDVDTLVIANITRYQEAYIEHMVNTLNDLNNVIWEIAIEPDGTYSRNGHSTQEWVQHMIDFIHSYEATRPKQHPVLYSVEWPGGDNNILMASNAEAISPNGDDGFEDGDPAASDGTKVILADTDHILWPYGDADWGWKMFTRGMGGIFFMDQSYSTYDDQDGEAGGSYSANENFRYNLGWMLDYANRMNLVAMTPRGDLCSSDYCLANPAASGAEHLVYLPAGSTAQDNPETDADLDKNPSADLPTTSSVSVNLSGTPSTFMVEWFNPSTGGITRRGTIYGGATRYFSAPFEGSAVLYLRQVTGPMHNNYLQIVQRR